MGWAIMLGHSGWEQKLGSDFKVLGGGGRRIRNDLETFAGWTSGNALVQG